MICTIIHQVKPLWEQVFKSYLPSRNQVATKSQPLKKKEKKVNTDKTDNNKRLYKEFVKLTDDEHLKLIEQLGQKILDDLIDRLNNYIGSTGKTYKSHYHTILTWHRKEKPKEVKASATSIYENAF